MFPEGKKSEECPFCVLASGSVEGRTPNVLYQDKHVVVFVDRNPSAYRHYLVIPNKHIKSVQDLRPVEADHALVSRMFKLGKSTLQRDAPNASKYRFGFHKSPFNSVDHLHLHCIALPYNSVWRRFRYLGVGWLGAYVSVEHVLLYLDPKKGMKTGVTSGDQPKVPI